VLSVSCRQLSRRPAEQVLFAEDFADTQEIFVRIVSGTDFIDGDFKYFGIQACVGHTSPFLKLWN